VLISLSKSSPFLVGAHDIKMDIPVANIYFGHRYVDTGLIPSVFKAKMIEKGMEFAEVDDAVKAILKISTDTTVNGKS
jgi:hypothetical protein